MPDYSLCGWRLTSPIRLPELPSWPVGDTTEVEIAVALGEPPAALDAPVLHTPLLQVDAAGRALFRMADVGDYLVEEGRRITFRPRMPLEAPDLRVFLLGGVFGLLCHQRGVLPIHAAAVEIDGEAVMLAGGSGAGKSTLAAAFARAGYRLLSDDVAPLRLDGDAPVVLPGLRRIRLWSDSLEAMGWSRAGLEPCRERLSKFSRAFDDGFVATPLRPAALFHLRRQPSSIGEARLGRLRGREAAVELRGQVYRWRSLVGMAGLGNAMARTNSGAGAIPRHYSFQRPLRYEALDTTVEAIVDTVRAGR